MVKISYEGRGWVAMVCQEACPPWRLPSTRTFLSLMYRLELPEPTDGFDSHTRCRRHGFMLTDGVGFRV